MPETPSIKLRQFPPAPVAAASPYPYAELDVTSNFSFLRGASHPDELVFRAAELGYRAIAITDRNSLAGVVRAHDAIRQVKEQGGIAPKLIIGARLVFADAPDLLVWPTDRAAYGRLCRLLTLGKRRAEKGQCLLYLADFLEHQQGMLAAIVAEEEDKGTRGQGDKEKEHRSEKREARSEKEDAGNSPSQSAIGNRQSAIPLRLSRSPHSLLREALGDRLSLAVSALYGPDDQTHLARAAALARYYDIPLLATNQVHYHDPSRRQLQDIVTCIRHTCTIQEAGYRLFPNGERYLKPPDQMHRLFAQYPEAIRRGIEIAERCTFSLDELKYEYPHELIPEGKRPIDYLRELAYAGAAQRYGELAEMNQDKATETKNEKQLSTFNFQLLTPSSALSTQHSALPSAIAPIPPHIRSLLDHELALIEQLHFEPYFLTVYDIVKFARSRGILCQGRGSAANSAVCFCLGVTSVDPARIDVLFERFISAARNEPPDIDVDFEHERREEVLQYIYEKYGRHRAGMTGVVITYRGRSAVRDVGKALGLSLDLVDQMAKKLDWWHRGTIEDEMLKQLGLDPADHTIKKVVDLTSQILGFPRHLSQHVGGMVMTQGLLCELVPIENAAMEGRTVIEWDKDDIDALGILKVDVLALGMLTCISKTLTMVNEEGQRTKDKGKRDEELSTFNFQLSTPSSALSTQHSALPSTGNSRHLQLHTIPPEDPAVYDMISDADTVGVFQIESRAQMSMLPRLRPRCFYDLVIEVAIVRPGPIQGDMVHPYLRRRNGEEPVTYPSEGLRQVLAKTLGVPLFQEQAMRVAMVGAGFSAGEADQLRRAMAAWRKNGAIEKFHDKIIHGMLANGYTPEFAQQCFNQIKGFGEYGFPESHAASFALLVYASAWLKRYHPAEFAAGLLNSQPMGFYAPAQIVRDAKEHGVEVRGIDVNHSDWDCTLEDRGLRIADCGLGLSSAAKRRQRRAPGVSPGKEATSLSPLSSPRSPEGAPPPCATTLSPDDKSSWGKSGPAVRLGFRLIKGLREAHARAIMAGRQRLTRFTSIAQFHRASGLPASAVRLLAEADAFGSLALTRRQALWQAMELKDEEAPLFENEDKGTRGQGDKEKAKDEGGRMKDETEDRSEKELSTFNFHLSTPPSALSTQESALPAPLPPMPLGQEVMTDYATTTLSLKTHPVALVRDHLRQLGILTAADIAQAPHGQWVKVSGLVLIRQRPGTASGIVFETLEDETGIVNLIVKPEIYDRYRSAARQAVLLRCDGRVQREGQVIHILARRLYDLSSLLAGVHFRSRDFH